MNIIGHIQTENKTPENAIIPRTEYASFIIVMNERTTRYDWYYVIWKPFSATYLALSPADNRPGPYTKRRLRPGRDRISQRFPASRTCVRVKPGTTCNIVGDIRRAHPSVFGGATGLLGRRSARRAPVKRKGLHNNGGNRFGPHCPLAGVVNNNNNDNIIPMHSHTLAGGPNHL